LQTRYGKVASAWEVDGDKLRVNVQVPPNTLATLWLPSAILAEVTEGSVPLSSAAGISWAHQTGDDVEVTLDSGDYNFSYSSSKLAEKLRRGICFSLDDSVGDIMANPRARGVVEECLPSFTEGMTTRFKDYAIRDVAGFMPQTLTPAVLKYMADRLDGIHK